MPYRARRGRRPGATGRYRARRGRSVWSWAKNKAMDWGINKAKDVLKDIPYKNIMDSVIDKGHAYIQQRRRGQGGRPRFRGRRTQRWGTGRGRGTRGGGMRGGLLGHPPPGYPRWPAWGVGMTGGGQRGGGGGQTNFGLAKTARGLSRMRPTPLKNLLPIQRKGSGGVQVLPKEYQGLRYSGMY